MIFEAKLARLLAVASSATVEAVHAAVGEPVGPGSKLLDLRIDLSAVAAHDCPPVSFYRLTARDRGWLRQLDLRPADVFTFDAPFARFTSDPDEPWEGPARPFRLSAAGLIPRNAFWDDPE